MATEKTTYVYRQNILGTALNRALCSKPAEESRASIRKHLAIPIYALRTNRVPEGAPREVSETMVTETAL